MDRNQMYIYHSFAYSSKRRSSETEDSFESDPRDDLNQFSAPSSSFKFHESQDMVEKHQNGEKSALFD